jgi:hypothetical protein
VPILWSTRRKSVNALHRAKQRDALTRQLRVAIPLAKLWRAQGLAPKAIDLLRSICERFADGSETQDIRTAAHLLDELLHTPTSPLG